MECKKQLPEEVVLGYISSITEGLETTVPLIEEIIEPDLEEYTSKLGYKTKFRFLIDDAQGSASRHLEIVQGYSAMGVNLFIGGGWSSQAYASLSYCNDNDLLMFSPSSGSPLLAVPEDNLYRLCPNDTVQAKVIADTIISSGVNSVIVLQRGDAWADGIYNIFEPRYIEKGGKILKQIRYEPDLEVFSQPLREAEEAFNKIHHSSKHKGILLLAYDESAEILQQAKDYPIVCDYLWFGSDATALSQKITQDVADQAAQVKLYSPYAAPTGSSKFNQLYDRYHNLTGQPLGYYSACTYDIAWILAQSILETQSTHTGDITRILPHIAGNYFGATGWTRLNKAGDRYNSNYQIWEYMPCEPWFNVSAEYDAITESVNWREIKGLQTLIPTKLEVSEKEREYTNEQASAVYSIMEQLHYIDVNFERIYGIPFFKSHKEDKRAIADLSKPCLTEKDFIMKMASLALIIDRVGTAKIKDVLNIEKGQRIGSITLLEEAVKDHVSGYSVDDFRQLRRIRSLRNLYPIHESNYDKLKIYEELGLSYPLDWNNDYNKILKEINKALTNIVEQLKTIQ